MSAPGEVAILQRYPENNQLITREGPQRDENGFSIRSAIHCMYPTANALNGPVGSTASSLATHQNSISGKPPDLSNFNLSSYPNRSQGSSSGLANLFPQSNDLQGRLDYRNDVIQMPPGSGNIGSGSKPHSGGVGGFMGPIQGSKTVGGGGAGGMALNENEFPSLISRPPPSLFPTTSGYYNPTTLIHNPMAPTPNSAGNPQQRNAYANFARHQGPVESQQQEFRISTEDFPALPGAPQNDTQSAQGINPVSVILPGTTGEEGREERFIQSQGQKKGIQTQPDGTVKDIPAGMLSDQYGMAGLLTFLRAIESDPGIVALALGHDLTTLGLNLNAPERNLYQNFGGPWADHPCRAQDIDFHVPDEYMTNVQVREKLPPIKLNRFQEDLLFYLFYNFPGDVLQMASAAELYSRDWRYHKEEKVWLTRAPGYPPIEQTGTYERGTYNVFDPNHWRKVPKDMHLDYSKLEERPQLPSQLQQSAGGSGGTGTGGAGGSQTQALTGPSTHNS